MNTLEEIEKLIENLDDDRKVPIKSGVLSHIQRAELYFRQAEKDDDPQFFNDTIYRCNQAYEGILREAYEIFSLDKNEKISTYEIEEYFQKENILNSRVKSIFTNYRKEWRNPSTHNHKLFFDKFESFMALQNVQSFIYILLNQILQSTIYQRTRFLLLRLKSDVLQLPKYTELTVDNVLSALTVFHRYVKVRSLGSDIGGLLVVAMKSYLDLLFPMMKSVTYLEKEFSRTSMSDITILKDEAVLCEIDAKAYHKILFENSGNDKLLDVFRNKKGRIGIQYYYSDEQSKDYRVHERKDSGLNRIYVLLPKLDEKSNI